MNQQNRNPLNRPLSIYGEMSVQYNSFKIGKEKKNCSKMVLEELAIRLIEGKLGLPSFFQQSHLQMDQF